MRAAGAATYVGGTGADGAGVPDVRGPVERERSCGRAGCCTEHAAADLESQIDSSFAGISGTQAMLERTQPCAGDGFERRGRGGGAGGGRRHAGACAFFAAGARGECWRWW